jgi:cellulose synthase/poly-beta-1,6-N-acetylglucosamine synthase-like glycosyltransferase
MPIRLVGGVLLALEGALTASTGYLLALLLAARGSTDRSTGGQGSAEEAQRLRLVVFVPAHDEENGIDATLESLALCEYPTAAGRIVVIADNCSDRTADRARSAGVEVWERTDPGRRSKGFALAWALRRLFEEGDGFDAVVVIDADCVASDNLLNAIDERLRAGAEAVQVANLVGNPVDSQASALRFGGFALMNTIRPLGKQRLGLSCGLGGTGMAFTRGLLRRVPWTSTGLAEDGEYHMRLVLAGERVEFVADASVSSPMPTTLRGHSSQQARWEQGKLHLIKSWSPPLLRSGLRERDVVRLHAGLECLIPPQSLIVLGNVGAMIAGLLLGSRRLVALSSITLVAHLTFVLAGLRLVGAPRQVYRALLTAPALIATKLALYARLLTGGGPTSWVRTAREDSAATEKVGR